MNAVHVCPCNSRSTACVREHYYIFGKSPKLNSNFHRTPKTFQLLLFPFCVHVWDTQLCWPCEDWKTSVQQVQEIICIYIHIIKLSDCAGWLNYVFNEAHIYHIYKKLHGKLLTFVQFKVIHISNNKNTEAETGRGFFILFHALLALVNDLLFRYLEITKIFFLW